MAASLGWKHQWPVRPHGHGGREYSCIHGCLKRSTASMPSLMSTFWFARTATRSHMVYSVSRSWVTRNTVRPSALRRVRINGRKMQPRLDPVLRWVRQETGCSHQAPRLSPVLLVSPCLRTTRPDTCLPLRQATPPSPACFLPNARQEAAPDRHARSKEERRSPRRSAMNTTRPSGTECRTFAPYARAQAIGLAVGRAPDTDHARMRLLQPDDATQEHGFPGA